MKKNEIRKIQKILDKIDIINFKYKKVIKNDPNNFNIFSLLRKESDEVYLHSKFIFELLNPDGTHRQGEKFLKLFLKTINIKEFSLSNITIKKEYKNIDIYLTNNVQSIIIENKIHARDQNKQLERYVEIIKKEGVENIKVIYLTLYGHDPSLESLGEIDKKNLFLASYNTDIDKWLELCVKECSLLPRIRETIEQYRQLIEKLTGKSQSQGYIMEISNMLMNKKNIRIASDLNEAFTKAKISIQVDFWASLEKELKNKGLKIFDEYTCSEENVKNFYLKSRNNKYYGIVIKVENLGGNGNVFYNFEIEDSVYHGFNIMSNDADWGTNKESKFNYLSDIVNKIDSNFERNEYWLGWKYIKPNLNFKNFNEDAIYSLSEKKERKKLVSFLANEAYENINIFKSEYSKKV